MNTRHLLVPLFALSLGLSLSASAADTPTKAKPGYTVVLEMLVDEQGTVEDAKIISSDDTTIDHMLDMTALGKARGIKLAPQIKGGHAVKYSVQAPFVFPVEGDQGPEANNAPRPKISHAVQPVYPADLAAKGEVGGAILEAVIGANGTVTSLKVIRSSSPVFAQAATAAVNTWTFIPAQLDGKPVESRWNLSICFETDVRTTDWAWRVAPRPSLGNYTVIHRTLPPETPAPAAEAKPATPPAGK
jgi:TonB family protein